MTMSFLGESRRLVNRRLTEALFQPKPPEDQPTLNVRYKFMAFNFAGWLHRSATRDEVKQ